MANNEGIMTNYVKFLKGSPTAYASLAKKDENTLYFVFNQDQPPSSDTYQRTGKLYLGDILVATNVSEDGTNIVDSLAELIDVDVRGLSNGQVLVYDANVEKWIPQTLPNAICNCSEMVGASATTDGTAGLVPAPKAGDQTKFLRGDGKWVEVEGSNIDLTQYATQAALEEVSARVTTLEDEQDELEGSMTWGTI